MTYERISRRGERRLGFDCRGLWLSGLAILHCVINAPLGQRTDHYLETPWGGFVELPLPPHRAELHFSEISSTALRFAITMMCIIRQQHRACCCQLEQTQMLFYINQLEPYRIRAIFPACLTTKALNSVRKESRCCRHRLKPSMRHNTSNPQSPSPTVHVTILSKDKYTDGKVTPHHHLPLRHHHGASLWARTPPYGSHVVGPPQLGD